MSKILLDTNIVTYITSDTSWKELYLPVVSGAELCISLMSYAELMEKAYRSGLNEKNRLREKAILMHFFEIIPFTEEICDLFGQIRTTRKNRPISVPDALIAATALTYELPLVTHNKIDFEDISPKLEIVSKYRKP